MNRRGFFRMVFGAIAAAVAPKSLLHANGSTDYKYKWTRIEAVGGMTEIPGEWTYCYRYPTELQLVVRVVRLNKFSEGQIT